MNAVTITGGADRGRRAAVGRNGRRATSEPLKRMCFVLAGFLICSPAAHAEIYQWVDKNGSVHFSDQPPPVDPQKTAAPRTTPAEPQNVRPTQPAAAPVAVPAAIPAAPAQSRTTTNREFLPAGTSPLPQIRALLREGRYAELNALLEKRHDAAARDVRQEDDLIAAYEAFSVKDPAYEAHFGRWVENSPQSALPYLARAQYLSGRGWEARGYRWASETSESQFARMNDYFEKSARDVREALNRRAKGIVPYYILLGMIDRSDASGLGGKVLAKALAVEPASFQVRARYLIGATPRWGGTYEEMKEIADEAMIHAAKNPKLLFLQGYVDYDKGDLQLIDKNYSSAEALFTKAISSGDYALFYRKRARARFFLARYEEALRDINRAIELWPHSGEAFLFRSKINVSLKRTDAALRDVEQAERLSPGDEDIDKQRKWLVGVASAKG